MVAAVGTAVAGGCREVATPASVAGDAAATRPASGPAPARRPTTTTRAAAETVGQPEASSSALASAGPRPQLTRAWSQQTVPPLRGVALTEAYVVVQGRATLAVLDRRRGNVLAEVATCRAGLRSVAAVGDRVWLGCPGEMVARSLPDLTPKARVPLSGLADRVAYSPGGESAMVVGRDGVARRMEPPRMAGGASSSAPSSRPRSVVVGPGPSALAASKLRFAIGRGEGDVVVYGPRAMDARRIGAPMGAEVEALAFAPDERHLLVGAGPSVAVWPLTGAPTPMRFSGVRYVVDAAWLDRRRVATVGADGLLTLDLEGRRVAAVAGDPGGSELIAVAAQGRGAVCAGDRNGKVICWAPGPPRTVASADPGEDARSVGVLVSRTGRALEVEAEPRAPLPAVGETVTWRHFVRRAVDQHRGAGVWLEGGRARVIAVEGARIQLLGVGTPRLGPGAVVAETAVIALRWSS
ncbi:MAG: hypothetical protein AAF715_02140 [Myxococcota bacterium]